MPQSNGASTSVLAQLILSPIDYPQQLVSDFCFNQGVARSTGFSLVKRLEEAALVERDDDGYLHIGTTAVRMAYAAYDLQSLHGPALPLCRRLRDLTEWSVALETCKPAARDLLFLTGTSANSAAFFPEYATLCNRRGIAVARLRVEVPDNAGRVQRDRALTHLTLTASALEEYVDEKSD